MTSREATAGDHPLVARLLQLAGRTAAAAEFHLQLEEPGYDVRNRRLAWHGRDVIGHVLVSRRDLHWQGTLLPVAVVRDIAILPEYRTTQALTMLAHDARAEAARQGAAVMLWHAPASLTAEVPGWTRLEWPTISRARPRDILAQLSRLSSSRPGLTASGLPLASRSVPAQAAPLSVRLWRHFELCALRRCYDDAAARIAGPWNRSEERWHWLISRHGHEKLYVAVAGLDTWEIAGDHAAVRGYAVVRDAAIVELCAPSNEPEVTAQLVARICLDALEHDIYQLQFEGPADHPLHACFAAAAGAPQPQIDPAQGWHAALGDADLLLESLRPLLAARWKDAARGTPELGLVWPDKKRLLALARRGVRITPDKCGRSYLHLTDEGLLKLALGSGGARLPAASSHAALRLAAALFPPTAAWLPQWDCLPAWEA